MNIGTASARSGVPTKTIRYYESINLIPAAERTEKGYRVYTRHDVETLRFVHHARSLGFSVKHVAALLALWQDRQRSSGDVKTLALDHVREIDAKIVELQSMRRTLMTLVDQCHGDSRPECPILDTLSQGG